MISRAAAIALALAALSGCRTRPFEIPDGDLSIVRDMTPGDAVPPVRDLTWVGEVLYGVNDHGETAQSPCELRGGEVGDYAFVAVPTGMGKLLRVDLFTSDPAGRTFGLAVYAGAGGGKPGQILGQGTLAPGPVPGWVSAQLDQPVTIGGVLWIGSTGKEKWTFACPWSAGGFGVGTKVGGPGSWQAFADQRWMFRLIGER